MKKPIIVIKCEKSANEAFFIIEDNGLGIEREEESKVFKLYQQANGERAAGFGIGLSLCKKIVELHKGNIWIDHNYTHGCRICLTIPQPADATARLREQPQHEAI